MNNFEIKRRLERNLCPVHHKNPKVSVSGDRLSMECCCETFKKKLIELTKQYAAEQAKKEIEDTLRNAFRR